VERLRHNNPANKKVEDEMERIRRLLVNLSKFMSGGVDVTEQAEQRKRGRDFLDAAEAAEPSASLLDDAEAAEPAPVSSSLLNDAKAAEPDVEMAGSEPSILKS
jgi:hypothetical protein